MRSLLLSLALSGCGLLNVPLPGEPWVVMAEEPQTDIGTDTAPEFDMVASIPGLKSLAFHESYLYGTDGKTIFKIDPVEKTSEVWYALSGLSDANNLLATETDLWLIREQTGQIVRISFREQRAYEVVTGIVPRMLWLAFNDVYWTDTDGMLWMLEGGRPSAVTDKPWGIKAGGKGVYWMADSFKTLKSREAGERNHKGTPIGSILPKPKSDRYYVEVAGVSDDAFYLYVSDGPTMQLWQVRSDATTLLMEETGFDNNVPSFVMPKGRYLFWKRDYQTFVLDVRTKQLTVKASNAASSNIAIGNSALYWVWTDKATGDSTVSMMRWKMLY